MRILFHSANKQIRQTDLITCYDTYQNALKVNLIDGGLLLWLWRVQLAHVHLKVFNQEIKGFAVSKRLKKLVN